MDRPGPLVSVCIRAHGRDAELREAIESALAQTFTDLEVLVSDDSGSLEAVVDMFVDPRVRYHHNARPAGAATNLRTAAGLARGQFLAMLDDDDLWLPGYLEAVMGRFERDPGLGVVFTGYVISTRDRGVARQATLPAGRHEEILKTVLSDPALFPSSALVFRLEAWQQGEHEYPLGESTVGDALVILRAAAAGWPMYFVDEPLVVYRQHPGQMSWSDPDLPRRTAATLERFKFADAECESLRRAQLAEAHLRFTHSLVRDRRFGPALDELRTARRVAPSPLGIRELLVVAGIRPHVSRWLSRHPEIRARLLRQDRGIWRSVRALFFSQPARP